VTPSAGPPPPLQHAQQQEQAQGQGGEPPARVLLIMGLAATCTAWHTQIAALLARAAALGRPLEVAAFDNRGVGRSSAPRERRGYTIGTMARDAAALMEHLGWASAHVVGFSMGSLIAAKLAAAVAPARVASLTLIGATAGGVLSLPRSWHAVRHSLRALVARSPIARARADLRLHFTKATLHSASSSASSASNASAFAAAADAAIAAAAAAEAGASSGSGSGAASASSGGTPQGPSLATSSTGGSSSAGGARRQKEDLIEEYVAHARSTPPQAKHVSRIEGRGRG
jgi:pimeloyl-ACP methyl ester carboxylesterase